MRNMWAVCKREVKGYFTTPVGFVILGAFAALSGLYFAINFLIYAESTVHLSGRPNEEVPAIEEYFLSPYLVLCGQLIMFIGPLITMRLLAEERNRGTMELLLTYPLSDRQIVGGKYLASLCMLMLMIATLGTHMIIVSRFSEVEPGVLAFGMLTVFLMGAAFLSMGLFVSAMAQNQITAGAITFGLWLILWVLGRLGRQMPATVPVPDEWPDWAARAGAYFYDVFRAFVRELPLDAHAQDMAEGVLRPHDVTYYLLVIAFFLFLTLRALESRQWRG